MFFGFSVVKVIRLGVEIEGIRCTDSILLLEGIFFFFGLLVSLCNYKLILN